MCKGWFHHPNTHWLTVHLWQNDTGRKGGDRSAGGERLGMTWALRSLCRPSAKSALTHHPQAGGGMAFGHRAPSGVWLRHQLSPASIYSRRQRRLVHRTQPRRSPGAWGPSATNKRRRVYTGALLATTTTINAYKRGLKVVCSRGILYSKNRHLKGEDLCLILV